MAAEQAKGWPALVARLRRGAPLIPWRIPGARALLNGVEYFIHHEDVRRADGRGPRTGIDDLEHLAWRTSGFLGRRLARRLRPFGLDLVRPDGTHRRFGAVPRATLTGPATELLLFLSGRRSAAEVTVAGSDAALTAIARAQMSL